MVFRGALDAFEFVWVEVWGKVFVDYFTFTHFLEGCMDGCLGCVLIYKMVDGLAASCWLVDG